MTDTTYPPAPTVSPCLPVYIPASWQTYHIHYPELPFRFQSPCWTDYANSGLRCTPDHTGWLSRLTLCAGNPFFGLRSYGLFWKFSVVACNNCSISASCVLTFSVLLTASSGCPGRNAAYRSSSLPNPYTVHRTCNLIPVWMMDSLLTSRYPFCTRTGAKHKSFRHVPSIRLPVSVPRPHPPACVRRHRPFQA